MTEPDGVRLGLQIQALKKRFRKGQSLKGFAAEFEHIWKHYPKKIGKDTAFKAFVARRREGIEPRKLYDATVLYAQQRHGQDDKFTMRGSTFFGPDNRWKEPFEMSQNGRAHQPEPFDLTKVMAEREDADPLRDL